MVTPRYLNSPEAPLFLTLAGTRLRPNKVPSPELGLILKQGLWHETFTWDVTVGATE